MITRIRDCCGFTGGQQANVLAWTFMMGVALKWAEKAFCWRRFKVEHILGTLGFPDSLMRITWDRGARQSTCQDNYLPGKVVT